MTRDEVKAEGDSVKQAVAEAFPDWNVRVGYFDLGRIYAVAIEKGADKRFLWRGRPGEPDPEKSLPLPGRQW